MLIVFLCAIVFAGCATTVSVTKKRISQNHRFEGGLSIYQLTTIDSFDAGGAPSKYKRILFCRAAGRRSLLDKETTALLKGDAQKEFLRLKAVKDSFDKANVWEVRPADTIYHAGGSISYIPAGRKRPIAYTLLQKEMQDLRSGIKHKDRKVIYFSRSNKYYHWYAIEGGKEIEDNQKVVFEPGQWYSTYIACTCGLLADGHCSLYFRFDKRGKVEFYRKDHVNDGPF